MSALARGYLLGALAFLWWGFMPAWFKAVAHVPVLVVLAHRVLWMAVFLLVVLGARGQLAGIGVALGRPRDRRRLLLSTALIACNWFVFLYAVLHERVLESSLGYFINPLLSVLLGMAFLGERLRLAQGAAVLLAAAGVLWLAFAHGRPPWLSLGLAVSFGLYGLVRKTMPTDALTGLAVESLLIAPLAIGWLLLGSAGPGPAGAGEMHPVGTMVLLVLGGPVTAAPLLLFVAAARRLPLATMGFLQYIAPTLQFLLAVLVYGEAFTRVHAIAFGLIWSAVLVYLGDAVAARRAAPGANRPR